MVLILGAVVGGFVGWLMGGLGAAILFSNTDLGWLGIPLGALVGAALAQHESDKVEAAAYLARKGREEGR